MLRPEFSPRWCMCAGLQLATLITRARLAPAFKTRPSAELYSSRVRGYLSHSGLRFVSGNSQ
eukprot:2172711-Pyramimonas_sp.AAC.2